MRAFLCPMQVFMECSAKWLSPYMHIPRMLAELHRVLVPGGWLRATLHAPRFTWGNSVPFPVRNRLSFVFLSW